MERHIRSTALYFFIIICFSIESFSTQTFQNYISLEDVIARSDYIVVAEKGNPFETVKEVSINPSIFKFWKRYPPYKYTTYSFKVVEQLYGLPHSPSLISRTITVHDPYEESNLDNHKQYYLHGVGVSSLCDYYKATCDINTTTSVILFLKKNKNNNDFTFVTIRSYESIAEKTAVVNLINKIKKNIH